MSDNAFDVDGWTHRIGGFVARHRPLWIRLGNLESRLFRDRLESIGIDRPIYVAGLARSGSTILLEKLASHGDTATHRYRDFAPVFTPILWNGFLDRVPQQEVAAVERSHKDGIMVTRESPEALEEMLWMAFFHEIHDPERNAVLDGATDNGAFEAFYREHVRKLLYLRNARRYVAKGNYNVTRFEYLLKLFPDARFVLPVRSPASHIASLMKQHRLFEREEQRFPRALDYMRRVGHFEFGLDRRPVNAANTAAVHAVQDAWEKGEEVLGWARYWAALHGFLAGRLDASPTLRDAVTVVPFEKLCATPRATLSRVYEHCGLDVSDNELERLAADLHFPTYYRPDLDDSDLDIIERETSATAGRFGYPAIEEANRPPESTATG